MAIAFFDLDGTLLPSPSSERRLLRRLITDRKVTPLRLARCIGTVAWQKLAGDRWALQRNKDYLAGLEIAEVARVAQRTAVEIAPLVRPALLAEAAGHAKRGDAVVLLTGTPEFLAAPLAEALGFDEACATRCATAAGRFLARPPVRHPFGGAKLALAREIAERHGVSLAACTAYADSRHDEPLLQAVGHAVAVEPDRILRAVAIRRGWQIIEDNPLLAPTAGAAPA